MQEISGLRMFAGLRELQSSGAIRGISWGQNTFDLNIIIFGVYFMKRWEIYLEIFLEALIFLAILFFIGYGVPKLMAFFWPIVFAAILAAITRPIKDVFEKHLKLPKKIGATIVVILLLALSAVVIYFIGSGLSELFKYLANTLPDMYKEMYSSIDSAVSKTAADISVKNPSLSENLLNTWHTLGSEIGSFLKSVGTNHINKVTFIFSKAANILVGFIVMYIAAYFMLIYEESIRKFFVEMKNEELKKKLTLIKENVFGAVWDYIVSQIKLMLIIGVVLFFGFLIIGVKHKILLAVLIAFVDAVPFLGTGTVLIPWFVIDFIQGKPDVAVGLLILYLVCLVGRQVLQPKIVGETIGLNPFVTLILMYAGTKIAGIVGFIIAVLLGIIVYKMYKLHFFDGIINRTQKRLKILKNID